MLGITLAPYGQVPGAFPYGVGYSYGGNGTFMCPDDPYQYQRGEAGFYSDTQLGLPIIPPPQGLLQRIATMWHARKVKKQLGWSNPPDMAYQATYGFVPQMSGWITTKEGFVQSPWVPPNGWQPAPRQLSGCSNCAGPQLRGLNDIPTDANVDPEVARVLSAMNDHNQKVFTLSIVTTLAVAVSAIVSIARNTRELRKESKLIRQATST